MSRFVRAGKFLAKVQERRSVKMAEESRDGAVWTTSPWVSKQFAQKSRPGWKIAEAEILQMVSQIVSQLRLQKWDLNQNYEYKWFHNPAMEQQKQKAMMDGEKTQNEPSFHVFSINFRTNSRGGCLIRPELENIWLSMWFSRSSLLAKYLSQVCNQLDLFSITQNHPSFSMFSQSIWETAAPIRDGAKEYLALGKINQPGWNNQFEIQ